MAEKKFSKNFNFSKKLIFNLNYNCKNTLDLIKFIYVLIKKILNKKL